MTMELAHAPGCDERHRRRQQCNGSVADDRRTEQRQAREQERHSNDLAMQERVDGALRSLESALSRFEMPTWLYSPKLGALLELIPAAAITIVWIGSLRESHQYHDFAPLDMIALLPAIGWLWRGYAGIRGVLGGWLVRVVCIFVAAVMWGAANDHAPFREDPAPRADRYEEHCCRTAYLTGMHVALGLAIVTTVASAALVGAWRTDGRPPASRSRRKTAGSRPRA